MHYYWKKYHTLIETAGICQAEVVYPFVHLSSHRCCRSKSELREPNLDLTICGIKLQVGTMTEQLLA